LSTSDGRRTSRTLSRWIASLFVLSLALLAGEAFAQSTERTTLPPSQSARQRDLSQVSLEDLMNIELTSVSKKEQEMSQAAATILVITQEDIHRSGATNIPDLLRMVPGLDVSQINANSWAVSVRGFNTQFENKLLVLIDGRAVYTPVVGQVNLGYAGCSIGRHRPN
jgi:outer membrane receptor for ferrienterochelin and colicin